MLNYSVAELRVRFKLKIIVYYFSCLHFNPTSLHILYKSTRYIHRRHQTHSFKRYYHSLLSCYSCHTSHDATELTIYYSHNIATAIVALFWTNEADMLFIDGSKADEVHHSVVRNCERWVLTVISKLEMTVRICYVVFVLGLLFTSFIGL